MPNLNAIEINGVTYSISGGGGGGAVSGVKGNKESTYRTGNVNLTPANIGALPDTTTIPSKTSDLTNDSNFVADANYVHTDNNYTSAEKTKLGGIASGAEANVQSDWDENDSTSDAYILNKPTIPSKTSDLTNDSGFIDSVKTINSESIEGTGDIAVQSVLVSGRNIKTINNQSLLGSGNINISGGGGGDENSFEVLWTNPNPSDSFAGQTIELYGDVSVSYKYYEIIYLCTDSKLKSTGLIPITWGTSLQTNFAYSDTRNVSAPSYSSSTDKTSIQFGDCVRYTTYGGSATTNQNTVCKPYQIIGWRYSDTTVPDGRTALPTDDIQTWLHCANIFDKAYTTISQVLSDSDTLLALLTTDNAINYMVRSTTLTSAMCGDSNAMAIIGAYDYAADKALANADWCEDIVDSTYKSSVLNVSVPTMTSATAPSGQVICGSQNSSYPAWQAFGNASARWVANQTASAGGSKSDWIGYVFTESKVIKSISVSLMSNLPITAYTIKASNDGVTYTDIKSGTSLSGTDSVTFLNDTAYKYWRLDCTQKNNTGGNAGLPQIYVLQFYGRETGGVQSWLRAGGIFNKSYTTLADVLADNTTLTALLTDNQNAYDYLVTGTALAEGICADATAMSLIGADNYGANKLLGNDIWFNAIADSQYSSLVLNVQVPTMTSNTAPSGECISKSGDRSGQPRYQAFDKKLNTTWSSNASTLAIAFDGTEYIGYGFTETKSIMFARYTQRLLSGYVVDDVTIKYQGSNDKTTWTDLSNIQVIQMINPSVQKKYITRFESANYRYFRLLYVSRTGSSNVYPTVAELQFYGREDV